MINNSIKPHYIVIQPIANDGAIYDESGEIITSPPITSINNLYDYEVMDHVFYINSEQEFKDYELLYDFAELMFGMSLDLFIEYDFDRIFVKFVDVETDKPLFGLYVDLDDDGEFVFDTVDFSNTHEHYCNGDCENCDLYSKDEEEYDEDNDYENFISSFYFTFL